MTAPTPDQIPSDILKAAQNVIDDAMFGIAAIYGTAIVDHGSRDVIARAILAERERCARISEAHVVCDWTKLPGKAVDDTFGKTIAAAIRRGKQS